MATTRLLQSNFAAGEASKRIIASGDLERYGSALALALNLCILPLGGAERRSGSIWAEDPHDHTKNGRLLPFVRERGDALAIVVCDEIIRFIDTSTHSYIVDGASVIIEIACPWGEADYPYLFSWQSADVVWIGDRRGTARVKVLKRVAGVWQTLSDLSIENGPFLPDENISLSFSGTGAPGAATNLLAVSAIFTADHVGALIGSRENTGAPGYKRWLAGETVLLNDRRYNAGRVYVAGSGGSTGTNSPIHDEGTVSDGVVPWTYLHDGLGVVRITSVTNSTQAVGVVTAQLPLGGTVYWGFGSFSDVAGWPRAGAIHAERMVLGGTFREPDTAHLSRVTGYGPDFADFKAGLGTGLVVDSDAVRRALNSGQVQNVLHYVSAERLYVFTSDGVHFISGPSIDEPVTPAGASARERCSFGSDAFVAPIKTGDSVLFVRPGGQELREIPRESGDTPNLTILVDHLGGRGIGELGWQGSPYSLVWARFNDGTLGSMTYERLERVRAWSQHQIGGGAEVTSAIVLPDPDGRQSVWCYVRRTIDGATRYAIEVIPPAWSEYRDPLEQACCLDAAGYFDFWNTDADNRARFSWLDEAQAAVTLETEEDTFSAGDEGKRFALRLSQPAKGLDAGDDAGIARIDVIEYVDARTVKGFLRTSGADALVGAWTVHWARMEDALEVGARLEGQSVDVFADGSAFFDGVVESGDVALDEPVARGWVGLRNRYALRDLPVANGSPIGTAFGVAKKVEKAWLIAAYATPGCTIVDLATGRETELVWRSSDDPTDRPPTAVEGYHAVLPAGSWSATGQIEFRQEAPLPMLILGIVKEVVTS